MLLQEPNYENSNENENFGRTTMQLPNLTPREENIHEILLKFMDDNGQGRCPAYSPDFLLQNIKPTLKLRGIQRVGKNTLDGIFKKSPTLLYDNRRTGTVYTPTYVTVKYRLEPNNSFEFNEASIGGTEISPGEDTIRAFLGSNEILSITINYSGIVDRKLTINKITTDDGVELELKNKPNNSLYQVTNNNIVRSSNDLKDEYFETRVKI